MSDEAKIKKTRRKKPKLYQRLSPIETGLITTGVGTVLFGAVFKIPYLNNLFNPITMACVIVALVLFYRREEKRRQVLIFLRLKNKPVPLSDFKRFFDMEEQEVIKYIVDIVAFQEAELQLSEDYKYVSLVPLQGEHEASEENAEGYSLGTPPVPMEGDGVKKQKVCPFCGVIAEDEEALFCKSCGASFVPAK